MQSGTVTGMAGTGGVLRIGDTEVRLRMPRKDTGALPRERIQVDAELVDLDDSGDDEAPPSLTAGEADDESTEDGYLSIFPHLEELGEAAVNTYRQSLCLDDVLSEHEQKKKKKSYKLRKVVEEVVNTERLYCESLDKLVDLQKEFLASRFLSSQEASLLFGNLEALVDLHAHLYSDIVSIVPELSGWTPDHAELEDAVLRISQALAGSDFLAVYAPYCANHPAQLATLAGRASDIGFVAALETWQQADGSKLPLNSYLLKPVQRILKYPLLVEELCRAAPEGSTLQSSLSQTCTLLQSVAQDANKTKRRHELETMMVGNVMVVRGLTLSDKLKAGGFEGDVASFGPLIDEAPGLSMTVTARRTSRKAKQRSLFLFRKALLVCKAYDDRRITVKKVFTMGYFDVRFTKRSLEVFEKGASAKSTFTGIDGNVWASQIQDLRTAAPSSLGSSTTGGGGAGASKNTVTPTRSASFTTAVERLARERAELQRRNSELMKEQARLLQVQAAAEEQQRAVVLAQQEAIAAKERELEHEAQQRVVAEEERQLLIELQRRDKAEAELQARSDGSPYGKVTLQSVSSTSPSEEVEVDLGAPSSSRDPRQYELTSPEVRAEKEFETILAMRERGVRAMIWNESEVPQDVVDSVNIESIFCLQFPLHAPSCHFDRYGLRGYLVKRGTFRKTWVTRWFVLSLKTKYLSYYTTNSGTTLSGSIPITNICTVVRADSLPGASVPQGAHVMHIVTLDRTYHMLSPDKDTLDAWVYAIGLMLKE